MKIVSLLLSRRHSEKLLYLLLVGGIDRPAGLPTLSKEAKGGARKSTQNAEQRLFFILRIQPSPSLIEFIIICISIRTSISISMNNAKAILVAAAFGLFSISTAKAGKVSSSVNIHVSSSHEIMILKMKIDG